MRSPSEKMVAFLVSASPDDSDADILEACKKYRLYNVGRSLISHVRKELEPIPNAKLLANPSEEEVKWLRKHGLFSIWTNPDIRVQLDFILRRDNLREFIESSHLAGYTSLDIAKMLPPKVDVRGVDAYLHYVFNLTSMSYSDIEAFLALRSPVMRAIWNNRGSMAKKFVLQKFGVVPYDATVEETGKLVIRLISERLFTLSSGTPSEEDASLLKDYTSALKNAASLVGAQDEASHELKKVLDSLELDQEDEDIITYDRLIGGELTNDEGRAEESG